MIVDNKNLVLNYIKCMLDNVEIQSYIPALIVTRNKDSKDSINYTVWAGTIRNSQHFEKMWPFLKNICDSCNGRLYISPSPRTFKDFYRQLNFDMAQHLMSDSFQDPKRLYYGALFTTKPQIKLWVLDVDDKTELNWIDIFKTKLICPTRQGYNIVIKPFDTRGINFEEHSTTLMKHGNLLVYANLK